MITSQSIDTWIQHDRLVRVGQGGRWTGGGGGRTIGPGGPTDEKGHTTGTGSPKANSDKHLAGPLVPVWTPASANSDGVGFEIHLLHCPGCRVGLGPAGGVAVHHRRAKLCQNGQERQARGTNHQTSRKIVADSPGAPRPPRSVGNAITLVHISEALNPFETSPGQPWTVAEAVGEKG